jgi:hypothetical protein
LARLFIGPREQNFAADIIKEYIKDIVGQTVLYYPISILKTHLHDVYQESFQKIYENPIELDCLVSDNKWETKENIFGIERANGIDVFVHARDLLDKEITLNAGDFFEYDGEGYEITSVQEEKNMFGQAEYNLGYKLTGKLARITQFSVPAAVPVNDSNDPFADKDGIQKTFLQQRGFAEDQNGNLTGDVRALVANGTLDEPISKPREISPRGDDSGRTASFYADDE